MGHGLLLVVNFLIVELFKKCTPVKEVKNGMLNNILNVGVRTEISVLGRDRIIRAITYSTRM
jgi:hypothetical protein